MFWKSVNRRRNPQEELEVELKYANGQILNEDEKVAERWSEYPESVLNVEDDRRAKLTSLGRGAVTSRNVGDHK
jgi:hypothetical protein